MEAVILDAVRTPLGRRDGALRDVHALDLLGHVQRGILERAGVDAEAVDDVIGGCVGTVGEQSGNVARNAWLAAGLPESVPATTVDRQCGSSLQALQFAAQGVLAGGYDVALACGVESMTRVPMGASIRNGPGFPSTPALNARYALPEGRWFDQAVGAEMIARRWGIGREELDRLGYESHVRAARAQREGRFDREILPIDAGNGDRRRVDRDEGVRAEPSLERMAQLTSPFEGLELITAGNSSQISDGAAAVLVASAEAAKRLGVRPRARIVALALAGVDPVTMLTGPIPATRRVLERAGLEAGDIDVFEVNEAFASVPLAWQREIGAPAARLNPNGGAIALGHPLGATGCRIVATLLHELERSGGRYGLVAICEGGGMANAAVIERLE